MTPYEIYRIYRNKKMEIEAPSEDLQEYQRKMQKRIILSF